MREMSQVLEAAKPNDFARGLEEACLWNGWCDVSKCVRVEIEILQNWKKHWTRISWTMQR